MKKLLGIIILAILVCIAALCVMPAASADTSDPLYLTFSSEEPFTLSSSVGWDGTLEYSTDLITWTVWEGTAITAVQDADNTYTIYLRGTGNTQISSAQNGHFWLSGCSISCTGNIETLLDYQTVANGKHPEMAERCFDSLFWGCTNLTTAPALPATNLNESCYVAMFAGCTNLTTAPTLPATTLADSCYQSMFAGCTNLTRAPELPAANLTYRCYANMFSGCTGLTTAPTLSSTNLSSSCYWSMFSGCTNLTEASALPATTLAEVCYWSMFSDCTNLTRAPTISATTLAEGCYMYMFKGCTNLTEAPALSVATLAPQCYNGMFAGCTNLAEAPALLATTLAEGCYYEMFEGCTNLINVPNELPATNLTDSCYSYMFSDCTNLTTAPELPATNLSDCCYAGMFSGCTGLITAPTLPATDLEDECYYDMFFGCTSLTTAPELPATNLTEWCYAGMFYGCTGLITAPTLPATNLTDSCYESMFYGCTGIKLSETQTGEYTKAWSIPPTAKAAADWNDDMFYGTGGTFTGAPEIGTTYYTTYAPYLTFGSAESFTLKTANGVKNWDGTLEYSTDTEEWTVWNGETISSAGGKLYLRGTGNTKITGETSLYDEDTQFVLTGTSIACTGNIETLLDYQTVSHGEHPEMGAYCFAYLFYGCTNLTTAPELPATELAEGCYMSMFDGCIGLTTAPELPATELADGCYYDMFFGCTSLTTAPELPATNLADGCYAGMFYGCISLTAAPTLPATTLADECYESMFYGCTGLVTAPELPATTLAVECYQSMFRGCTGLTTAPELPATTLADECYDDMFYDCTALTTAPELPATTLAVQCYDDMFYGCTSLTTVPELPATDLKEECYDDMFKGCTSLKLSETQTGDYTKAWSVPSTANAESAAKWNEDMFYGTGGTFTGAPEIGKTYYMDVPRYTVIWNNDDGSTLKTDERVDYGTMPTYTGETPTKDGYIFSGWKKDGAEEIGLTKVTEDTTYTAVFIEKPAEEEATLQPVIQAQAETKGGVTTITGYASDTINMTSGTTATITDGSGAVTLTVTLKDDTGKTAGEKVSNLSGEVTGVTAEYNESSATTPEDVGDIGYQLTVELHTLTTDLPPVDATINSTTKTNLKKEQPKFEPAAMITVDGSTLDIKTITLTFLINKTWADNAGKLWSFHVSGTEVKDIQEITLTGLPIETDPATGESYKVILTGSTFSSYGIAAGEYTAKQNTNPSPSSQGSSVWLTETPTPTETAPTPTETDVAPTSGTAEPTEAESPVGVLAVVAGLGAAGVVLRRR